MNDILDCPIHHLYVAPEIAHLPCLICMCHEVWYYRGLKTKIYNILNNIHKEDEPVFGFTDYQQDLDRINKWHSQMVQELKYFHNHLSYLVDDVIDLQSLIFFEHLDKFQLRPIRKKKHDIKLQINGYDLYQPIDPEFCFLPENSPKRKLMMCKKPHQQISFFYREPLVRDSLYFLPMKLKTLMVLDPERFNLYGLKRNSNDHGARIVANNSKELEAKPQGNKPNLKTTMLKYLSDYRKSKTPAVA